MNPFFKAMIESLPWCKVIAEGDGWCKVDEGYRESVYKFDTPDGFIIKGRGVITKLKTPIETEIMFADDVFDYDFQKTLIGVKKARATYGALGYISTYKKTFVDNKKVFAELKLVNIEDVKDCVELIVDPNGKVKRHERPNW